MIDDYQYIASQLTPKNEGPFGLGGKPNEGSRGFSGITADSQSLADSSSFNPSLQGPQGPQGPQGAEGPEGPLIDGNLGDMLYHDGSTWVPFGGVGETSILKMEDYVPGWRPGPIGAGLVYQTDTEDFEVLRGSSYGDMLFWDGSGWSIVPAASGEEIHVLASSGGTPYWIQTEACDASPP
jgi:hypothetical protein